MDIKGCAGSLDMPAALQRRSAARIKAAIVAERAHLDVARGVAHNAAAVRGQLHNAHTLQAANKVLVAVAEAIHERR